MALSFSLHPVTETSAYYSLPSRILHHHVHRARGHLLGPVVCSVCFLSSRGTTVVASRDYHSLLFSASFERESRNSHNNSSLRNGKASAASKKHSLFRVLCSSLQGGPIEKEPNREDRRGPRLQWTLLAAGMAAAGVVMFMRLREGGLGNVGASDQVTLQLDPGFVSQVSSEGLTRFTVRLPGLGNLSLGETTPGWVYFLLLMAAGFGLFVSEEALNVWVGASLGRLFSYESRESFLVSLSANSLYLISTILWVYWGVCISDMVPFYAGRLASRQGDQISQKLGVSKDKYEQVTGNIRRYGNLIGFVERFSVGIRNPTSFLAGVAGISSAKFFAGVCLGGLFTLPIQISIGFVLRERPIAALAGVAAVVAALIVNPIVYGNLVACDVVQGGWTVFPYVAAGIVSLYYLLRRSMEKPSQ